MAIAAAAVAAAPARPVQAPLFGSPLDQRYGFDSFVEGSSNRVALAAARTIAEAGAGAVRFNPLFIHSSVGLGKTHLLQAIALAALQSARAPRVVYLTAEYFMWRFATAIRDNDALSLKESLRNIDLLIIDDMQFLQGKSIQHEFCHLLNMLLDSAKQVVVAADRAPWELESLDSRVRSRLQGGVAIEMEGPDYEMRLEMLKRRLEAARQDDASLEIPLEILSHVARNVTASGRELEGAFNQLLFRRSFEPQLSIERVDELLGHLVNAGEPRRVRIEDIQRVVAKHYNVSRQELVSNRRTRVIVKPRQIAMYLSKTLTPRSFPEIGRRFGGRDHTTVLHAVRKIEELISADTKLSHEIELLKRLINE
ncbi:chromosomal replication initiator protein [Sinorhizobium meliloti]